MRDAIVIVSFQSRATTRWSDTAIFVVRGVSQRQVIHSTRTAVFRSFQYLTYRRDLEAIRNTPNNALPSPAFVNNSVPGYPLTQGLGLRTACI